MDLNYFKQLALALVTGGLVACGGGGGGTLNGRWGLAAGGRG